MSHDVHATRRSKCGPAAWSYPERQPNLALQCETADYKTVGDLRIRADVYRPLGKGPHPVVVFIHGGALIMGSRSSIDPLQASQYLDDGFAVVSIDYRLAPETKLPAIASDLDDAFAWIRGEGGAHFQLDPARVAVLGHSAGGYLALLAGHRVRPRPRAVVSFYGYGDIVGPWYSQPDPFYRRQPIVSETQAAQGIGDAPVSGVAGAANDAREGFYLYCRQQGLWPQMVVGHDPMLDSGVFAPFCPVLHVTSDYPPTLLLHGDSDTDVPYEQSVLLSAALQTAGVPHELITVENGAHGFDEAQDRPEVVVAFERVRAFLKQHTR